MSPPRASTSSRAASASIFTSRVAAVFGDPADRLALLDPRQFDDGAIPPERLPDALVALLVGHVHAPGVGRDADVVGHKNQHRIGVGIFAVGLDGGQFLFVRSASEQGLDAADEKHLKGRHQRRRAGAVENFRQIGLGQIKIKQAEVAQVGWDQVFENGFAATLAEEGFVAHENIRGTQLARLDLGDEAVGLGEGPHQKPSRTLLTRVRANSRDSRSSAGESSSKKLESSRET